MGDSKSFIIIIYREVFYMLDIVIVEERKSFVGYLLNKWEFVEWEWT